MALVAKALEDDSTLAALVDGQIIPGFRRAQADDFLAGPNHACIGVRAVDTVSTGLPGCAYHNISEHDLLIEFHLIQVATDDTYLAGVADQVQQVMKKPISKPMNDIAYFVSTYGPIRFNTLNDDIFVDRIQITGTCRLKVLDA
ncbi:MAG: hypothetical protein WC343_01385 [Bacilli bacterium]